MFDFDELDDAEESGESPYSGDAPTADRKENGHTKTAAAGAVCPSAPDAAGAKAAGGAAAQTDGEAADCLAGRSGGAEGDGAGGPRPAAHDCSPEMFDFQGLELSDPAPASTDGAGGPLAGVDTATRKGAELLRQATQRQAAAQASASAGGSLATASTAGSDAKVYWKVVKTVDAAGIAVRSDGPQSPCGRLQLHSVVVEKERKGNDLRYQSIDGRSWGPRSGWVKIEGKGNTWMECLGSELKEDITCGPSSTAKRLKALILFDWDDTLCPTSWIEECPQLRWAPEGQVPRHGEAWEQLTEQADAVKELVQTASSLASVALVTLAQRPWVSISVRDYLPAAEAVTSFEVFYAGEWAMARSPSGACPLTAMKRRAMQSAMETAIARLGQGTTWESLISIGDSEIERRAAQDLGRECQNKGWIKYTKTVKMLAHPSVTQLTSQCRSLNERLHELVNFPGHRQITSAELLRSH